jgi:glycosyltransferase involved in cell wall biosynthesis
MKKKKKVLVVAYACDPNMGSEPGVGWHMVKEIARFADPFVLVSSRYRDSIEREVASQDNVVPTNIHWVYTDPPAFAMWIKNKFHLGTQIHYVLWQWCALLMGRRLHRIEQFDFAHHLTYGVTWISPTISLLGIPFVWGPIGGGDIVPRSILVGQSGRIKIQEFIYWLLTNVLILVEPISLISRRRAGVVLFRSRSVEARFPKTMKARRIVMSETACDDVPDTIKKYHRGNGLTIIGVGRMQYWKAYRWAIHGFHRYLMRGGDGHLTLLGDGPDFDYVRNYCQRHGLTHAVSLPGKVSHEAVQKLLSESDVLIHPSFRDGGSWSVMEALSNGLPVVCANASGVADMVDETCGIRIDACTNEDLVEGISQALATLSASQEFREELGRGARKRVKEHYNWYQRGEQLREIYDMMAKRQ